LVSQIQKRGSLSSYTKKEYGKAKTYDDGKWQLLTIDIENVLKDAFSLLAVKRKKRAKRS